MHSNINVCPLHLSTPGVQHDDRGQRLQGAWLLRLLYHTLGNEEEVWSLTLQPVYWATAGRPCRPGCTAARHTTWSAFSAHPPACASPARTPWHLRAVTEKVNGHITGRDSETACCVWTGWCVFFGWGKIIFNELTHLNLLKYFIIKREYSRLSLILPAIFRYYSKSSWSGNSIKYSVAFPFVWHALTIKPKTSHTVLLLLQIIIKII